MDYVAGIDLGTSSVKVVLMDKAGHIAGSAGSCYPIQMPRSGWAEQDPEDWWTATKKALKEVVSRSGISGAQIKSLGFSGQMHGMVPLDQGGDIVSPAIIWMDLRSDEKQSYIERIIRENRLEEELLNRPVAGTLICSLLWMKRNMPELCQRTAHVLLPKDYIRFRLGGTIATDETDASGSLAFSIRDRQWCDRLLTQLGISKDLFPNVAKSREIVGAVTAEAAAETGLLAGTPLVAGGADSAMQLTGNGMVRPGTLVCNIGTGAQMLAAAAEPLYDRQLRTQTFCHSVDDLWYLQSASLNGGGALAWLREHVLSSTMDYGEMDRLAGTVKAGSEGVMFLPYLAGERVPYLAPTAKGVFFGLTRKHGQAQFIRAVMEGVILNLRECLTILEETGIEKHRLLAAGGGAKGAVWRQIQADMFQMPVYTAKTPGDAATGAAMMAAVGTGWYASVPEAVNAVVRWEDAPVEPIPENVRIYEEKREMFRDLYQCCKKWMA